MGAYDERITTYFGDAVLRAGFMPVPHLLMRHYHQLGLQSDHAMFVLQLMEITWDLGDPPATIKKIAERMGVSVRTVQRYSEFLAARELIVIYEQFEHGAQVENGYDLSPLFARLAALAPEPPLSGTPRERRRRGTLPAAHGSLAAAASPAARPPHPLPPAPPDPPRVTAAAPPPVTNVAPGDDTCDTRGSDRGVTGARVTAVIPAPDTAIRRAPSRRSGLNGSKNLPKNHQEPKHPGAGGPSHGRSENSAPSPVPPGWSLRWQTELTPQEVRASTDVLEHFGVHADVAEAAAPTLAPAEAWALGAYATGARLGPGWIAHQVFAFDTRQPRPAPLARRYDAIGQTLAALPHTDAERALVAVDRACPDTPEAVSAALGPDCAGTTLETAVRQLWALMNELRHGRTPILVWPEQGSPTGVAAPASNAVAAAPGIWAAVLALLRAHVPAAEFATWIEPATLLYLEGTQVVIGAPNVFVREQIERQYLGQIEGALRTVVGRPLCAQMAISS